MHFFTFLLAEMSHGPKIKWRLGDSNNNKHASCSNENVIFGYWSIHPYFCILPLRFVENTRITFLFVSWVIYFCNVFLCVHVISSIFLFCLVVHSDVFNVFISWESCSNRKRFYSLFFVFLSTSFFGCHFFLCSHLSIRIRINAFAMKNVKHKMIDENSTAVCAIHWAHIKQ